MRNRVKGDVGFSTIWRVECRGPDGKLLWVEEVPNIVVDEGLTDILQQYFNGSAYTAAWYMGLIDATNYGAVAADDTAAKITTTLPNPPTTNNWQELTSYNETARPAIQWGTAANNSIDNSANAAVFTMSAAVTVKGVFSITDSTKGGTAGKIYSEALFSSNYSVPSGSTLTVTLTHTAQSV